MRGPLLCAPAHAAGCLMLYSGLTQTIVGLCAIFLARHWLPAITNVALTALLGSGLLYCGQKLFILGFSPTQFISIRRFVLLLALSKGVFYLVMGVSRRTTSHHPVIAGMQIPDPVELLGLVPTSPDSIWLPTSATRWVSLLLLSMAICLLFRRLVQMVRTGNALNILRHLAAEPPQAHVVEAFRRAVAHVGPPPDAGLPVLLLAEVPYPTPVLIGVRHPYLLLSARLSCSLTDAELEMAFRHELAHFQRRDYRWRWLFAWLEDVGRLNPLSALVGTLAGDLEEDLCDRLAVHTPEEALALANAVRKSASFYQEHTWDPSIPSERRRLAEGKRATKAHQPSRIPHPQDHKVLSLPLDVLPALRGRHTRSSLSLRRRLQGILSLAQETHCQHQNTASACRSPFSLWRMLCCRSIRCGFGVLLFLIIYTNFYLVVASSATKPMLLSCRIKKVFQPAVVTFRHFMYHHETSAPRCHGS